MRFDNVKAKIIPKNPKKIATHTITLFLLMIICAIGIFPLRASGQEVLSQKVLVLHSYHRQLSWVKSIEKGILNHFEKVNPSVELRFEYMDTKRITDPNYGHRLYDFYQYKFKDARFDAIICSDNNALNFLLNNRNKLFPDTPVVFCGINNFKNAMIEGKKLFTGTVEGFSFKETLSIAIKLHPETKQIIFYGDNSPTYLANKDLLKQIAYEYKPDFKFIFKDNIDIKQIQDHIRRLNQDSLILIGSTIRDENGKLLSFEQSIEMMEKVSHVPIYGCWDFYLGHGIIGGKLISGFSQGEIAAKITNRIINGENANSIPVIKTSPNRYMFDYHQLKKFNIKINDLPMNSIVINKPHSFYSQYKNIVWGSIATVSSLLIIILVLVLAIKNRKRAEKALQVSERKLSTHLQNTPIGALSWDLDFKATEWNQAAETIFGYPKSEAIGKHITELILPDDIKKLADEIFKNLISEKGGTRSINENLTKDGRRIVCDWYNTTLKDSDGNVVGVASLVSDITDNKLAEKKIKNHAGNLKIIFNSTPNILVLVNDETRVEMINHRGAAFLGKKKEDMRGLLAGEVLNCLNSFDGKGCGRNADCSLCPVRTRIMSTFEKGNSHIQEDGRMTFLMNGKEISMDFLISTALLKIDGTNKVLLSLTDITAWKKTGNLLQKQQYFLKKAQEIGQIGTWELDIKKNELLWTDENYKIFGIPIGTKLTYEIFLECVHPDDREYLDTEWKAAFNKKPYDVEHRLLVDGKVKWVRQKAELEFNENDECISGIGFTQDITDRKHMIEEQQESDFLFSQMFEQTTTSTGLYIPDGTIIKVNSEFCKMFGVEEKTIINAGYNLFKDKALIVGGVIPLLRDVFDKKKKKKWEIDFNIDSASKSTKTPTSKTGKIFLEVFGYPVLNSKDDLKYVALQHYDITNRKLAEEALKESEARLKKAQSVAKIGNWEYDIATGTVWASEQAFQIYGLERTSPYLPLDKVEACIPDVQRVNKALVDLIQKNKKYDIEFEVHRKSDRKAILIHSLAEVAFNKEVPIKILGIIHDITEQRKFEYQLQQSQKMESIGTLAGGIAHDFNNILFPIVGHTEMLLEDVPEDSPFRVGLKQIYTGAMRASELVKQILTFSRQESSELKLMKMQPIIKEALKLIRSTIPTTIEIKQNIQPDCGAIKADPTQIHQIVMNLCTNAYHSMEENGGVLKVSLKEMKLEVFDLINPDMEPGVYACLIIADSGIGMNKKLTDKIFDPFFTTKEKGKGTGMGLSVVHGIVNSMGGAIHVYSEPGAGTQFHVYLPVEKNLSEKQVTHSKIKIQGGIEQILLVDDEEAILTMEKMMLERLGYQVTSRTSSIEALEAFRDNPDKFDVIITDMAMPNMSGDKLSVELNKIRPDIPVLLCTGFSETMSEEKAASLGIKGFLLKPIVMKDLSQKIREVLDNKLTNIMEK